MRSVTKNQIQDIRYRVDWLPSILVGAVGLATAVTFFHLAIYFKESLGFSGAEIGVLFAVHAITGLLVTLPAGLANDRLTSRTLVAASLVVHAVSLAGIAAVRSYWPFVGVYFVWGLASGLFRLSLDVQVLKTDTGEHTGRRIGLYQACRFGGMGIGLLLTGYVLSRYDFEGLLIMAAVACLALVLPALWLTPTSVGRVRWSNYWMDMRDPRVLFFAGWLLLFASHWGAEATSYGLFLRENLRLSMSGMGWYMIVEFLAITLTLVLCGRHLNDARVMKAFAVAGLAASGIGQGGMVFEPLAASVAFRALHGVGDGLMFLVIYFGIARLFAVERLGGNTGFISMATMLGYVVGSLIYGPLGELGGYHLPLLISGAVTLVLAPALLAASPLQDR